jgi:hypothetical protein
MALALGKLTTGTPKFRGSGSLSACTIGKRETNHSRGKSQFPQSQCHPSPRTGIALCTRLSFALHELLEKGRNTWKRAVYSLEDFLRLSQGRQLYIYIYFQYVFSISSPDKNQITIGKTSVLTAVIDLSNQDEVSYNPEVIITHDTSLQYEKMTVLDVSIQHIFIF